MKYRVRLDLPLDNESDAQALMALAKTLSSKASSINEGEDNEEIAFADIEKCYHDDTSPQRCEPLERVEIRKVAPVVSRVK